jgi:hypothetical protein
MFLQYRLIGQFLGCRQFMDRFRFGSAFSDIFKIGLSQYWSLVLVSSIVIVPVSRLGRLGIKLLLPPVENTSLGSTGFNYAGWIFAWKFWLVIAVYSVIIFVFTCIAQTIGSSLALAQLRQKPISLNAAFTSGWPFFGRVAAATLRMSLLVLLMMLPGILIAIFASGLVPHVYFVVPWFGVLVGITVAFLAYFVVTTMYAPLMPVILMENLSGAQAMDRAAELTAENRWRIFGIFVTLTAVAGVFIGFFSTLATLMYPPSKMYIELTLQLAVQPFVLVAPSVIWMALKRCAEGDETSTVADVFA